MDKLTVRDVDASGQAGVRARRLQRPARGRQGHRRLAHPRRHPHHPLPAGAGRAGDPREPPRPARRQGTRTACGSGRSPSDWPAARAARCPSPAMRSASARRTPSSACATARCCCSRTSASTPRRRRTTRRSPRPLAAYCGPLRERRVRHGPPRPRQHGRRREAPARLRGPAHGARDRDALGKLLEQPGAAVRGDHRRRQGLRQDQGPRQPAGQGRRAGPRRRHGQHVPARPGQARRQEPRRARPCRGRPARSSRRPSEKGVRVLLPVDVVVAKEVTRGTEYKTIPAEKIPA